MNINDFIYDMDHYDAWTFLIVGPLSLISSLSYIVLNIFFKQARKFPGNLLIIISIAELFLCLHWIASGFHSKYIDEAYVDENSNFCKINSNVAFIAANF